MSFEKAMHELELQKLKICEECLGKDNRIVELEEEIQRLKSVQSENKNNMDKKIVVNEYVANLMDYTTKFYYEN
jgi:hypothetical protein